MKENTSIEGDENMKNQEWSQEFKDRLSVINLKLFKTRSDEEIFASLNVNKPNLFNYLDLVYQLIEGNSKFAKTFWDAFVSAHAFNSPMNHVLDIKQLKDILELVEENNFKMNSDDSTKLLDSLKEFIATNGLVQKCSEGHIDFKETINLEKPEEVSGIIAEIKIEERFKNSLITKYKQVLLDCIFIIHGITPTVQTNIRFNKAVEPRLELREFLSKHNLIRNFDIVIPEENNLIEAYRRRRVSRSVKSYEWVPEPETHRIEPDWEHEYDIRSGTFSNYTMQGRLISNQLILFQQLIDNFNKDSSIVLPKFVDFLRESSTEFDYTVSDGLDKTINKAFKKLEEIISARLALERKAQWYYETMNYPGANLNDYPPEEVEVVEESGGGFHLEYKAELVFISINELAKIAMLKESKTIRNEMIKGEGVLRRGAENDTVDIFSAREWLNDARRKYTFYDLVEIDKLCDENITLEILREIRHKLRAEEAVKRA